MTWNRLEYLAGRDQRAALRPVGPSLAEALADRGIALIRIRARVDRAGRRWHDLSTFTAAYRRLYFHQTDYAADRAAREDLAAMVIASWPAVDWTRDHQLVVATGEVQFAPESWEHGAIPEDDLGFGGGPARYLPIQIGVAA